MSKILYRNRYRSDHIKPLSQTPLPHPHGDKYDHDLHNIMHQELTTSNMPLLLQNGDTHSIAFSF